MLEGLRPYASGPGMYIGSTGERGLHHLVYEVVDNAVDEALAGYCDMIVVTHPAPRAASGRSTTAAASRSTTTRRRSMSARRRCVLTMLHAGGKFGGGGYKVSGGLHGVGVSVVNALSSQLARRRHAGTATAGPRTSSLGEPVGPLQRLEPTEETGTTVTFYASTGDLRDHRTTRYETLATLVPRDGLPQQGPDDRPSSTSGPDRIDDDGERVHRHLPLRRRTDRLRRST